MSLKPADHKQSTSVYSKQNKRKRGMVDLIWPEVGLMVPVL